MDPEIKNFLNIISGTILLIVIVVFFILTLLLNYHWDNYEISIQKHNHIKKAYFIVSIALILVMLGLFLTFKI